MPLLSKITASSISSVYSHWFSSGALSASSLLKMTFMTLISISSCYLSVFSSFLWFAVLSVQWNNSTRGQTTSRVISGISTETSSTQGGSLGRWALFQPGSSLTSTSCSKSNSRKCRIDSCMPLEEMFQYKGIMEPLNKASRPWLGTTIFLPGSLSSSQPLRGSKDRLK